MTLLTKSGREYIIKAVFDFCTRVTAVFAYIMIALSIFCFLFGEDAKGLSSIFSLGSAGLPVSAVFQFLGASVLIVGIRSVFSSDILIKKMPYVLRSICSLALILIVMTAFVAMFGWFPIGQGAAWALFLICFGVSSAASLFLSAMKMKAENEKLNEALERIKNKNN